MDKIILENLSFLGKHGVYKEEKEIAQEFSIDLEIDCDINAAAKSDDLSLTMDYQLLYQKIKKEVEESSYDLLETLAEKIAGIVLAEDNAMAVKIILKKCRAKSGDYAFTAGVVIERSK